MGTAFQNQYIVPKAHSGRRSVSVFGIVSSRGLGPLIRIDDRFDGDNYINILNDTVLPYIEEFNLEEFFYYQDNSPVHRSRIARQWFDDQFFPDELIRTPAKSFDINPIENVWGTQKVRVANDGIYADEEELWLSITDTWNEIRDYNETLCENLVNSISLRLRSIIEANGSHTNKGGFPGGRHRF
jgi:hypothetical protein